MQPRVRVQRTYGNYPDWWNEMEPKELPPLPPVPDRKERQESTRPRTAPPKSEQHKASRNQRRAGKAKPKPKTARQIQKSRLGKGAWNAAVRVPKPPPPKPQTASTRKLGRRRRPRKAGDRGVRKVPKYLRNVKSKIGARIKEDRKGFTKRLQTRNDFVRDIARNGLDDDDCMPSPTRTDDSEPRKEGAAKKRLPMRFGKAPTPEPMLYYPKGAQRNATQKRTLKEPERTSRPAPSCGVAGRAPPTLLQSMKNWSPQKDPQRTNLAEDFPFLYSATALADAVDDDDVGHAGSSIMDIADALLKSDVIQAFSEGPLAEDDEDITGDGSGELKTRLYDFAGMGSSPRARAEAYTLVPRLDGLESLPRSEHGATKSPSELLAELDLVSSEL